jgi:hypothetical protein
MAERLLFGVVERIIKSLGSPAAKETGLRTGVSKMRLKDWPTPFRQSKMCFWMRRRSRLQEIMQLRTHWLGRLEDAMYDADDLLDAVSTEALRKEIMTRDKKVKQVCIFFSKSNQLAYGLKMAHKIKAMRKRLDAINTAARDFHLKCAM